MGLELESPGARCYNGCVPNTCFCEKHLHTLAEKTCEGLKQRLDASSHLWAEGIAIRFAVALIGAMGTAAAAHWDRVVATVQSVVPGARDGQLLWFSLRESPKTVLIEVELGELYLELRRWHTPTPGESRPQTEPRVPDTIVAGLRPHPGNGQNLRKMTWAELGQHVAEELGHKPKPDGMRDVDNKDTDEHRVSSFPVLHVIGGGAALLILVGLIYALVVAP